MGLEDIGSTTSNEGDRISTEAISPLGRRLREIRRRFIEEGGTLLTSEELDREIAERRGGSYRFENED
ncbi:MAG: hypothetical protein V1792_21255 [Pseudomonadota bacterium]